MDLREIRTQAKDKGWISEAELGFLSNENPLMASFYVIPKIHKCLNNLPGRSGKESFTEPESKYIDYFVTLFLPSLPAFIKDNTDVLNKIQQLGNSGKETFPATMDVESRYTTTELKHSV